MFRKKVIYLFIMLFTYFIILKSILSPINTDLCLYITCTTLVSEKVHGNENFINLYCHKTATVEDNIQVYINVHVHDKICG